jgi:putative DNA methylase
MNQIIRKKLIEVSIPLEAINVASAREKSLRHGHPSTLHLWWARRPLAACRAILFAQLVDDPSSWPDRFKTEEEQDAERKRLHKVIERLVPWEASNDEAILNEARWEIARSVAWGLGEEPPAKGHGDAILNYLQTKAPPIYDPFSGGGSIPLEAQRLGLRAYGSDLNPVAVLIGKALVEIPPKFAGKPPVNPKAQAELERGRWNGKRAQGLAEDVRYYGQWMRDEAEKRIGNIYPKARLPDGSEATVMAWLWARTVRSPDPAAKGAMVPLASSFMLSTKKTKKVWVEPVIDAKAPDGWRFVVKTGLSPKADEDRLKLGTKAGKAQAFVCILTGSPIERTYIQVEGKADRLGQRLMAMVTEGSRSRVYISPNDEHEATVSALSRDPRAEEARATFLSPSTPTRAMITGGVCSAYGLRTYGHLFTERQLIGLTTLSALVAEAKQRVLGDAQSSFRNSDLKALNDGGLGANAYADAVATYLGMCVSRQANRSSSLNFWDQGGENIQQVFGRQALAMVWDFCESNPLSSASGGFLSQLKYLPENVANAPACSQGYVQNKDAAKNDFPPNIAISTDPPYYDNIGYADLSDFFYVWLKNSLSTIWPDMFRRLAAPKEEELVATTYRHGSKALADAFFMKGMGQALVAMRNAAAEEAPLTIYYAFKQSEQASDGLTSAGWASFLQAVVDSGLSLDGTWPVRTELTGNLKNKINVLASSIVLVCRKRSTMASAITRADFVHLLRRELPEAINKIRKGGVGPVDMQQSVIGPGMGVFSRFLQVLEDDDSAMTVRTALTVINRVWDEIENEAAAAFDPVTQVALTWFESYGFETMPSGELIALANAKNTSDRSLFASKVFKDGRGRTGLTPRSELPENWNPDSDKNPTIWECVQHTARALEAEDGGQMAAARLVKSMGRMASDALTLTDLLYKICSRRGSQQEALVYNGLAQEWPKLEDLANEIGQGRLEAPAQATLL